RDELLQHLLGMLSDDDPQARRTAAITLGWLKEPRAVRPLLELLLEPELQEHVRISLVAPLIHDPSVEVRAEAVTAIGRLGDEDAVMLLFELLGDERELIQERAMAALAQLEPERVSPLLLQGLR